MGAFSGLLLIILFLAVLSIAIDAGRLVRLAKKILAAIESLRPNKG